jgi:putative flippase GtrA
MKRLVLGAWRRYRQQILYLIVGGWNTVFQYGVFSLCWYLLHTHLGPDTILLIAYVIGSVNGFLGFRYIVFAPASHPLIEYLKYQVVYAPLLALNIIALPLLLRHTNLSAYAIQALLACFVIVAAYIGNKYFTFRRLGHRAGLE